MPFTYDALRGNSAIRDVEQSLFEEQGGICAYTGISLGSKNGGTRGFHIEHLTPQKHCTPGEDTEYTNLVACWPEPNYPGSIGYGAVFKGELPSPSEKGDFVSPLRADCTSRFTFNGRGEIAPSLPSDRPAKTTIKKLGLDDPELTAKRRQAIRGTLNPTGKVGLDPKLARRLSRELESAEVRLDAGEPVTLRAFHFVLRPVVARHVKKLESIRSSKRKTR